MFDKFSKRDKRRNMTREQIEKYNAKELAKFRKEVDRDTDCGVGCEVHGPAMCMVVVPKDSPKIGAVVADRGVGIQMLLFLEDDEWVPNALQAIGTDLNIPLDREHAMSVKMPDTLRDALDNCLKEAREDLVSKLDKELA